MRPSAPGEIVLPRELVLASAGTGKTYTLSTRVIALLLRGAPPESLLASTFTRKAAGEILGRVLTRLAVAALDPDQARRLAQEVALEARGPEGAPAGEDPSKVFSHLLRGLVRELHRINVGTLDSFFVRIAGSFAGDLGIPPDWGIMDEPTALRLESEALQEVLASANPVEMAEMVRMTMRGESSRGVHQRLLGQMKEIRGLLHQQGPADPEAVWGRPSLSPSLAGDGSEPAPWPVVIQELEACPLPTTAKGSTDSRFLKAVERCVETLKEEAWDAFCEIRLVENVINGEPRFAGKPIPLELQEAVEQALAAAARALREQLGRQTGALRKLATAFDQALSKRHRREGAYRFEDLTFLLAGGAPTTSRADLWYRLDQRAHHILLDEFQDTSRPQWEALEPLTLELLAGPGEERSALIVADPKQSIYGWRGAEPSLAARVGTQFGLRERPLHESYRSSGPVLHLVNEVFSSLATNPVWARTPDLMEAVEGWAKAFHTHRPHEEREGYVRFEVGPPDSGRGSDRPALMEWAARRVLDLHSETPGATVGVLVRRNAAVALLMSYLRRLGLGASEEGATALTDSPAVATCLALLRLADHPGDAVARYQVALSPLGAVSGLTDFHDPGAARWVALRLRQRLMVEGYGPVITGWARTLRDMGALDDREESRMLQLAELGHRWDPRSTLRPQDFVRFVEHEALEAPSEAPVRVMTVHKAKGLEFDIVVLPELDLRLTRGRGLYQAVLPLRDPETGRVLRIFPSLARAQRALFPEVAKAAQQDRERELQDALGVVYVALTRARHALYLLAGATSEASGRDLPYTPAGLLRGALVSGNPPMEPGEVLYEKGSPTWWEGMPLAGSPGESKELPGDEVPEVPLLMAEAGTGGRRHLRHRTPSSGGELTEASLARVLSLGGGAGRRRGTLVHAWLERLDWLEDWDSAPETLLSIGKNVLPDLTPEESGETRALLVGWLEAQDVRRRLRRDSHPAGSQVLTEEPFAFRWDDVLYRGRIDRLVLVREGEAVVGAEVLDFKTDEVDSLQPGALAPAAEGYREQMQVYRRAVGGAFGLPLEKVRGSLVFLTAGRVVDSSS